MQISWMCNNYYKHDLIWVDQKEQEYKSNVHSHYRKQELPMRQIQITAKLHIWQYVLVIQWKCTIVLRILTKLSIDLSSEHQILGKNCSTCSGRTFLSPR